MEIKHYNKILGVLKELKEKYPTFNMGRHLSIVLSDYGDSWGIPDKELHFALAKYMEQLDLYGGVLETDNEIDKIIKGAQNEELFKLDEEEEDEI